MQKPALMKHMILILLFILAVILSACGKEDSGQDLEKYFGVDFTGELAVHIPQQVICGQECAWVITASRKDFIYQLAFDDKAAVEKLEWQPEEGEYTIVNAAEHNGMLYLELYNLENNALEIYQHHSDDSFSHVMSIKAEETESYKTVGSGFFIDESKNVYLVNGNTVAHFDEEGNQVYTYKLDGIVCLLGENGEGNVECATADGKELILHELAENRVVEKWKLKVSAEKVHGIRCSGQGTLCLATDREFLFLEEATGRLVARTDFERLGIPAPMAGYYDVEKESLWLYSLAANGGAGLRYNLLSSREACTEQRTELTYGVVEKVNLDTSSSIRTAINTFNQENKEYYVTIRDYDGNLQRMQADMAVGKGPDIIDMMYSDYYEDYVKNGYLENLSPYLEESQFGDDIIWNVLDAYKIDDRLYLFIPQFRLHGLLIHPEYKIPEEEWNVGMFFELIKKNRWEKDILGNEGNPESLLQCLLYGRQEQFIDWKQKTADFETEEFRSMLELCREYAGKDWSAIRK